MSQIDELQSRIATALDRISRALEEQAARPQGADPEEVAALRAELADEKLVTAQLEERNKRLKERLETVQETTAQEEEEHRAALKKLDGELQSLRRANQQLRDNNKALREAHQAGVAEPHLINKAMLAELEGLRAARNADRTEAETVITEITRLLNTTDQEIA